MPDTLQRYRVFISSPADLSKERQVVQTAAETVSQSYRNKGVLVEPWRWEDGVVSEFGMPPQDVINKQLGKYDIYIGLMGARFGSPTERFGSGTEEEFEQAMQAYHERRVIRVSFLFKQVQTAVSTLSATELAQATKVREFRDRIGPLGVYHEFTDEQQLSLLAQRIIDAAIADDVADISSGHQYGLHTPPAKERAPRLSKDFFNEVLNCIDVDITNGARSRLTLEDVWVDPDLRMTSGISDDRSLGGKKILFGSIVDGLKKGQNFMVYGGDMSGRSSLCRRTFVKLWEAGYFPILLEAEKVNSPNADRVIQRVRTAFAVQYENLSVESARDLPKDKTVLIIDDFDQTRLRFEPAAQLLTALSENFQSVLVSSHQSFALSLFGPSDATVGLGTFQRVEIKELGQQNRYKLIERWCLAGQMKAVGDERLLAEIEQRRRIVNTALRTNLVPRTPVMVLILLQAIDGKKIGDLSKAGYVRYYKFLIDSAILRTATPEEAEVTYAFLPEVAWAMHKLEARSLRAVDMDRVIDDFSTRRALRKVSLYSTLAFLRAMGMFEDDPAEYRFKHRYVYYFFLGDYMSRNLDDELVRQEVEKLCREIAVKDHTDTLIFLSFHTDNSLIIDLVTAGLSQCYANAAEFEFSTEGQAGVNQLIRNLAKHVIDRAEFAKNRERRLEAEDNNEDALERQRQRDEKGAQFQAIFPAIEVIGHILRNHYARLDAEQKVRMLDAAVAATLRCLGDTFKFLSENLEMVLRIIRTLTDKVDKESKQEKREAAAKRAVFLIVMGFTYYLIRTLVRSVGDETLEITYQQVMKNSPEIISEYVRLAIKLDCFHDFPIDDLKKVADALRDNHLATSVLRLAVKERLDMTPPPSRDLQRICDAAGLQLKPILLGRQIVP
jgi:hypothetical protein